MKKAFDQTVRDLKRGVNKKVLKVPTIEQKVLDATSNETWGPHGSLLADIAMASRNYHEYQMIMSIIWKRINDTGKNWRHVYKGLTVLEYLVANGSERVIEEIKEHSYQITSLSEFQYLDHTGRDQGNNVRKKSQSLVALVNDKERIQEVRQKAAANWDKFHNTSGGRRPGSYPGAGGYEDDRYGYGSRDDDRNGYGREREWGDDKYGGSRDGDRYGEERYGRDRYRDDGRRSSDGDNYGSSRRSRSSDRDRERNYEDEGPYSSRESNEKGDGQSHDGRNFERKSSEQNLGGPPSYEDAVSGGRSPISNDRDGETKLASPPVTTSHSSTPAAPAVAPPPVAAAPPPPVAAAPPPPPAATTNQETNGFDEFDPRGSFKAAPPTSGGTGTDLFGSSPSDPFSLDALALVPVTVVASEPVSFGGQTFVAASSAPAGPTQGFEDPFGDGPFRAAPTTDVFSAPPQPTSAPVQSAEPPKPVPPTSAPANNFGYSGGFDQTTDFLAELLPPTGPSQTGFTGQPSQPPSQGGQPTPYQYGQTMGPGGFPAQMGPGFPGSNGQPAQGNFYGGYEHQVTSAPVQPVAEVSTASTFYQQPQPVQSGSTLNASTGALVVVSQEPAKFETKSAVWADTLNRGLVNLNIAGSKTNPMSSIGVDFEALNRKEKRMEKPSLTPMTSNITMGKAMGSGSGIGRAGAGVLRPQPNPMMRPSMAGPGAAPGYGVGYGAMNQQPMGQYQMQPPSAGYPPPGAYNPMMGRGGGGYGQQPYGGGYR
ncbi:ENTH/VHS family protein [Artemisia annua]|uniref:ENTH/VHS family protein n=1 Tax=Artemisia annua TaxID=35608 RepID=A0A2U1NFR2_ARTAN|nr:ENTH/VHS family protein [Artemisia annua]